MAAVLLQAVWGRTGEKVIAIMIAIAALTSVNGSMIVGARSNYALGRDWPMLGFLGKWDEASGSPRNVRSRASSRRPPPTIGSPG